jgi:choline dehydrogenase
MDAKIWFPAVSSRQEDRITAGVVILHEKSRGRVTLASGNISDAPRIQLNLFDHPDDLETAKRGIEAARHIYSTRPQADLVARETAPGAALKTDSELEAYIRASSGVTQHPVGTCAMGIGGDAVVSPELQVHGITGLRVVDASVMPTIVGANTNAAVIMIAEKASDLILGKAPLPAAGY